MTLLSFFLGPAVGAVIGGLTNKVAIKMLFWPYDEKHIGSFHIPLTPGIIPKERNRIASNIGATVSRELLNSEVLSGTLLSDEIISKIDSAVDNLIISLLSNETSLQDFIDTHIDPVDSNRICNQLKADITAAIAAKVSDPSLGPQVARMAIDQVVERMSEGFFQRLGAGIIELMRNSIERKLADIINDMLQSNAPQMIDNLVSNETDALLGKPIKDILKGKEDLLAQMKGMILKSYCQAIQNKLPAMLDSLNIQRIIEDRINSMDVRLIEKQLTEIMDKELKALVWFGVLLGFIMGFITNLI